jgi:hypothetical protein
MTHEYQWINGQRHIITTVPGLGTFNRPVSHLHGLTALEVLNRILSWVRGE